MANADLVTFAEAKKLRVYPMLLAQFLGVVHEIRPEFLNRQNLAAAFFAGGHFAPALVSLGSYSGNSQRIVDAYPGRMILVNIEPNFDVRVAAATGELFRFGSTDAAGDGSSGQAPVSPPAAVGM